MPTEILKENGLPPIQSTAGAIPVRNKKGEIVMEKVKVTRYVTGKRPDYAIYSSSEEEEEERKPVTNEQIILRAPVKLAEEDVVEDNEVEQETDRLKRLAKARNRRYVEPEILGKSSEDERESDGELKDTKAAVRVVQSEDEEEDEEEPDEDEIEKRRAAMRAKARAQQRQDELLEKMDTKEKESDVEEESEYEEYTDSSSEEEDNLPRFRPIYVKKKERDHERDIEERKHEKLERQKRFQAEAQRRETLRQIEAERKRELEEEAAKTAGLQPLEAILTDDEEGDEAEYESWKVRELKRIKRDRDHREELEKERIEIERLRNMTEEERQKELKENGKLITNQQKQGKYKFMQKYYHRGAYYLNEEEDVLKRNFAEPTLEDHFDKTVLPKVMQVKDFGRSGRTKYTHLVDQDTTQFDSPWVAETATNQKFYTTKGGGMKQVFIKPTVKKTKKD